MDKYIKELLDLNFKVILPGFGAIVKEEESGMLSFNRFLTYDDGKLAEKVEASSNKDAQESKNTVAKFVREIQHQLNKGETYTIYGLGTFSKEGEDYLFTGDSKESKEDSNKEKSSSKKENTYIPPTPTVTNPQDKTEKDTDRKKPKPSKKEKEENKKEEKKKEKKQTEKKNKKETTKEEKNEKEGEKDQKRRGGFFWVLLIILLLIVIGLIIGYFNYDKIENYMGWNKFEQVEDSLSNKTDDTNNIMKDTMHEEINSDFSDTLNNLDTSQTSNITNTPPPSKTDLTEEKSSNTNVSSAGKPYHIIVGAFQNSSNAEGLVEELKANGYTDAKIIGKIGELSAVSIGDYSSSSEAQDALNSIPSEYQGAWIFKR